MSSISLADSGLKNNTQLALTWVGLAKDEKIACKFDHSASAREAWQNAVA